MPVEPVWSPRARADLLDIYITIGRDSPSAAERLYDRIEAKVALLGAQPRMGMRRPDIRPSTRILVAAPYLVLYEIVPDSDDGPVESIEIVRVVDARRDLRSLFRDD